VQSKRKRCKRKSGGINCRNHIGCIPGNPSWLKCATCTMAHLKFGLSLNQSSRVTQRWKLLTTLAEPQKQPSPSTLLALHLYSKASHLHLCHPKHLAILSHFHRNHCRSYCATLHHSRLPWQPWMAESWLSF